MKIAILLAGPYRGNSSIIESHKKYVGEFDTYVSCFQHYFDDWQKSGWSINKFFITPKVKFSETKWSNFRDDIAGQSGFWQFWNLKNLIDNVDGYDWYVKSRCDLLILQSQINLDFFNSLESNTLYCSEHMGLNFHGPNWDIEKTINDQFYIGDKNCMNVISNFVTNYYDEFQHEKNGKFSNETNLKEWLDFNKIEIKKIKDIYYEKDWNGISKPSAISTYQLENF